MRNTKLIGDISESKVISALVEKGWTVSIPFGENSKYDLIADSGEELFRVQVKTGRLSAGVIVFNGYTSHAHRGGESEGYRGKADLFGVYCPELDAVYLVPVEEVPEGKVYLRVENSKKEDSRIRWAKDFEI